MFQWKAENAKTHSGRPHEARMHFIPHRSRYGILGYAKHTQAVGTRAILKKLRRLKAQPPSRVKVLSVVNLIIKTPIAA
jgi:hypothetical protein